MPLSDALPLTVLVGDNTASPIEIFDQYAALHLAVVERSGALDIGEGWDGPGVYVLVDRISEDGSWGAYVGKAPAGVKARIKQHLKHKDHWERALLIRRDTTNGFTSAQVGWLEGRIYDLLDASLDAELHNHQKPGDNSLPAYDIQMLELAIMPISRVLRLLGYDTSTADDQIPEEPGRANRFFGITIPQLIEGGLISAGQGLVSTNGAWPALATLNGDGTVQYNGASYPSLSAASGAAKDGGASNGWEFWAVQTENGKVPLATLRARYLEEQDSM